MMHSHRCYQYQRQTRTSTKKIQLNDVKIVFMLAFQNATIVMFVSNEQTQDSKAVIDLIIPRSNMMIELHCIHFMMASFIFD